MVAASDRLEDTLDRTGLNHLISVDPSVSAAVAHGRGSEVKAWRQAIDGAAPPTLPGLAPLATLQGTAIDLRSA